MRVVSCKILFFYLKKRETSVFWKKTLTYENEINQNDHFIGIGDSICKC